MAINLRAKCPHCGNVYNALGPGPCPKCRNQVDTNQPGMLQLYRMGNPMGMAVPFSIYINGQPYGHLANKESIRIPLPLGAYTLHMAHGMSRRCVDLQVNLTPQSPYVCAKAHLKVGMWSNTVVIELANPNEMPQG